MLRGMDRVGAVLVTHRRPVALADHLDRLAAQTRPPDVVVVVDNDPGPSTEAVLGARGGVLALRHRPQSTNVGPAGGFALGMAELAAELDDDDWILLLDDDDPPPRPDSVGELVAFARTCRDTHPRLGGVGTVGARFDPRAGRIRRLGDGELVGAVPVDYLGGNHLPLYRVAAVRDIGGYDARLFFGLEELEFGLRMAEGGWELLVDGERMAANRRGAGRLGDGHGRARVTEAHEPWRAYYALRNLVVILRRRHRAPTAVWVSATRGLAKGGVMAVTGGRAGRQVARADLRAVRDGWSGRLGRTVEPGPKAGVG